MSARGLAYHNTDPARELAADIPKSQVKAEFARRLQRAMIELGLNQSELAKRASKFMEDKEIGRYSISCYITGKTIPRPDHLNAIAQALNVKPKDLLPTRGVPSTGEALTPLDVKDMGNGKAHIRVNQTVDWQVALEIMKLLNEKEAK